MINLSFNFQEEFSSKLPDLTLLTTLGYEFIPPNQCNTMRSSKLLANQSKANKATNQVVLLDIIRVFLAKQTLGQNFDEQAPNM
ncbi:hypothetical protein [Psychrobacter sanguinis]|uniref:hypothetical protein n=1 Tax=Psychrobacter sanguinis TaxID=861445 RepID=UPI00191AA40C|nr:hypothetical protein [Psychrobacter sanguinis]MCC3309164.1 hypothetical protein [Psychrobacter sanguinis]UEC26440.1 hypothetical protein LK453_04770 [Psychrobacter sanguinis]